MAKEVYLIAHNIRSIYNVGSFFRTADGAGVKKIYLCGYTPTPTAQFPISNFQFSNKSQIPNLRDQHQNKISKTALGAEKYVPWEYAKYAATLIKRLRKEGVCVVALEQSKRSKNIFRYKPKFPTALVVGNENRGLARSILKECDDVVDIPMKGKKKSLNVAVAAGIALYILRR